MPNQTKPVPLFLLIGLPNSGKTTICKAIAAQLGVGMLDMDRQIKRDIHPDHEVVKKFKDNHKDMDLPDYLFTSRTHSKKRVSIAKQFMRSFRDQGESLWRELEGEFGSYLLRKMVKNYPDENKRPVVDIGGKIFLNNTFRKTALQLGYKPVYFKADELTVAKRLANKMSQGALPSNYAIAAENASAQGQDSFKAVKELALQHRSQRTSEYERLAPISVDVSGLNASRAASAIINRLRNPFVVKVRQGSATNQLVGNSI